jgi:excisionase family DNA binding protein
MNERGLPTEISELPDLATREEVASVFRCHPDTVGKAIKAGRLPGVRVGKASLRIYKPALLKALESGALDGLGGAA